MPYSTKTLSRALSFTTMITSDAGVLLNVHTNRVASMWPSHERTGTNFNSPIHGKFTKFKILAGFNRKFRKAKVKVTKLVGPRFIKKYSLKTVTWWKKVYLEAPRFGKFGRTLKRHFKKVKSSRQKLISKRVLAPPKLKTYFKTVRTAYNKPFYKTVRKPIAGVVLAPNELSFQTSDLQTHVNGSLIASLISQENGDHTTLSAGGDLWSMSRGSDFPWSPWYSGIMDPKDWVGNSWPTHADAAISVAEPGLISKLYEKVKNSSVDLGTAFAEREQTVKLVGEILTKLAKMLAFMIGGRFIDAARVFLPKDVKSLGSDWLCIQYGVKPLISDLNGIVSQIKANSNQTYQKIITVKRCGQFLSAGNPGSVDISNVFRSIGTSGRKIDWTLKYTVMLRITDPFKDTAKKLGLLNPRNVAWEILPYSFIIDWILPIGNYLSRKDAFSGVEVVYVHRTVVLKETAYVNYTATNGAISSDNAWRNKSSCSFGWINFRILVKRTIVTLPTLPLPKLKNPLSLLHLANAMALLTNLRKVTK